jgi:hypothetical protein
MPQRNAETEIIWRHYDRLEPGEYLCYCTNALRYFDKHFRRHTCLLVWDAFSPALEKVGQVRWWINLGSGVKPKASRTGRYWKEWIRANNDLPPKRNDQLSPRIFLHRMARVLIADAAANPPYSVVRELISWETGTERDSLIHSNTQPLKEGIEELLEKKGTYGNSLSERSNANETLV